MNFRWMVEHISSPAEFAAYGVGTLVASFVVILLVFRRSGYL